MSDNSQPLVLRLSVEDFWRPLLAEGKSVAGYRPDCIFHTGFLIEFRDGRDHQPRPHAALYHAHLNGEGHPVYTTPGQPKMVGGDGARLLGLPGCAVGTLRDDLYRTSSAGEISAGDTDRLYRHFRDFEEVVGFVLFSAADVEFLLRSYPSAEHLYLAGAKLNTGERIRTREDADDDGDFRPASWTLKLEMPTDALSEADRAKVARAEGENFLSESNRPPYVIGQRCGRDWRPIVEGEVD